MEASHFFLRGDGLDLGSRGRSTSLEEYKKLYSHWETSGKFSVFHAYDWFDCGYNFMRQSTEAGRISHAFFVKVD